MDIKERMARQMHRVKVEAAIAATKTPPPDYVFKEPQMPKPMSEKQKVQAFIEDRTYDDIPMDQSKIDPKRVTSMADVHRIIISEQPREFVIGPKEQLNHKAPNFRNIGQEAIEGPGYSAFKENSNDNEEDRMIQMSDSDNSAPALHGIKIDLSGSIGKTAAAPQAAAPAEPPPPPPQSQPKPAQANLGTNVPPGTIEMTDMQRQMLAAMRAQRGAKVL